MGNLPINGCVLKTCYLSCYFSARQHFSSRDLSPFSFFATAAEVIAPVAGVAAANSSGAAACGVGVVVVVIAIAILMVAKLRQAAALARQQ